MEETSLHDCPEIVQAARYSNDSMCENCPVIALDAEQLDDGACLNSRDRPVTPVHLPRTPIGIRGKSRPAGFKLRTVQRKDVLIFEEASTSTSSTASAFTSVNLSSGWSRTSSSASGRGSVSPLPTISLTGGRQTASPAPFAPPCWSMRYCEFMGSVNECLDQRISTAVPDTSKAAEFTIPRRERKSMHKNAANNHDIASESVFLAKNARDKRLNRLDDADYKSKLSRSEARRGAITNFGQSRLQVQYAVKIMFAKYPGHMRKVAKTCKMKGNLLQVDAKALSSKELDELSEKVGMHDDEIQTLYSAFIRYDVDDDGFLNRAELRQGIADLGLQPRNREEKIELQEVLSDQDAEGLGYFSFNDYLSLVKTIRERLRQIQMTEFMITFGSMDRDGSRTADWQEAVAFLRDKMGILSRSEDETLEVQGIFNSLDSDNDGQLSIEECQDFVQRVRAKLSIMRREEEMTIAKAFHLSHEVVMEFRMDLPLFWEMFNRYDSSGSHRVARMDIMGLLMDVGVAPAQLADLRMQAVEKVVREMCKDENDFVHVLCMIHEARRQCTEAMMDELMAKFKFYDRSQSGALGKLEIFQILEDFHMLPKCREEQHEIAMCIERLDADGSGTFDFQEFLDFFQRLTEQVEQGCRRREAKVCKQMGFSDEQITLLRRHFLQLNHNLEGKVALLEMAHALPQLRLNGGFGPLDDTRLKELTKRAQQAPDHAVAFTDFVGDVHYVMYDWGRGVGGEGDCPPSPKQGPSGNAEGASAGNGDAGVSSVEVTGTALPKERNARRQRTKELTNHRASSLGSDADSHKRRSVAPTST